MEAVPAVEAAPLTPAAPETLVVEEVVVEEVPAGAEATPADFAGTHTSSIGADDAEPTDELYTASDAEDNRRGTS